MTHTSLVAEKIEWPDKHRHAVIASQEGVGNPHKVPHHDAENYSLHDVIGFHVLGS